MPEPEPEPEPEPQPQPHPHPHRIALALVAAVVVAFAVSGAWALAARSTIPVAIDAEVTSVEVRQEKNPGVDDVWLVGLDGRTHHLDGAVARTVQVGDTVVKERFSWTLLVDGEPVALRLSDDARTMLGVAPGTAAVAVALAALLGTRRREG